MMDHSIEMFWTCVSEHQMIYGNENVEARALALYKTDGCLDAIPFQFYRTTTIPEDWVGLDWKLIYLSISSLTAKV